MIFTSISPLKENYNIFYQDKFENWLINEYVSVCGRFLKAKVYSLHDAKYCKWLSHKKKKEEIVYYLAKVIKPAGMNFQELRNLSPITTARVPEVPAVPQWRETVVVMCLWQLQLDCHRLTN